jgi:hypothetical protein
LRILRLSFSIRIPQSAFRNLGAGQPFLCCPAGPTLFASFHFPDKDVELSFQVGKVAFYRSIFSMASTISKSLSRGSLIWEWPLEALAPASWV